MIGICALFILRSIPFYQFHTAFGANAGFVETQVGVHGAGVFTFLLMLFGGFIAIAASRDGT